MSRYYILARKDVEGRLVGGSSEWPKVIGYNPESNKFILIIGEGHGANGVTLSIEEAEDPVWNKYFLELSLSWFLGWIKKEPLIDTGKLERILSSKGIDIIFI